MLSDTYRGEVRRRSASAALRCGPRSTRRQRGFPGFEDWGTLRAVRRRLAGGRGSRTPPVAEVLYDDCMSTVRATDKLVMVVVMVVAASAGTGQFGRVALAIAEELYSYITT